MKDMNVKRKWFIRWYRLRCSYCGTETYKPYFYLVFKSLLKGRIYNACPICHKSTCYVPLFNIVTDHTDKNEKILNKDIWDSRCCHD